MKVKNLTPMVYEKTSDGEVFYDIFSRLIKERIIFLTEAIDAEVASTIAATLFFLDHQDSDEDISLYINSPGGAVDEGLFVIYDMMQLIKAPIKTVCIGEAMSAAALILASGTKGKRYALPNSKIMIHQVQVDGVGGTGTDVMNQAKSIKELKKRLTELLARHCNQSYRKVYADCELDKFMTAEEALEYGIIDSILQPSKEIPPLIKNKKEKKKKNELDEQKNLKDDSEH